MVDSLDRLVELTADVVAAYVSTHQVAAADLPGLIAEIHVVFGRLDGGVPVPEPAVEPQKPAVSIKKSVQPDFIICLEDGKKFKSLKRHLRTAFDLTPQEYREKWGLPSDYPMVAPNYAQARSDLARKSGLGQQRRRPVK